MEKKPKKTIWLIRHAESMANADPNYRANEFSIPSLQLSELGFKQAEKVIEYFKTAPDLIVTSSFLRTKQTAKHVLEKYPNVPHEEWGIHEFTYLSLNRCFNTSFAERKPFIQEYWDRNSPTYFDGEGSETFADFMGRTRKAIELIKNREENFIVLFSHQYTIAAFQYLLENNPKEITEKEMKAYREYFLSNKMNNTGKIELFL